MIVHICRKEHFNAAHKLYNPAWSKERNEAVFGPCANENWHGHNFELIVTVKGEPDPETGFVIDLKVLGGIIKEHIIKKVDHKNLNLDCPEFNELIPSAENIAYVIWHKLRNKFSSNLELEIELYETPRNWVVYAGK